MAMFDVGLCVCVCVCVCVYVCGEILNLDEFAQSGV